MRTGGQSPEVSTRAPISASGSATRRMGLRISVSSPTSSLAKDCPASRPMSRRMAVPALPQSSGTDGACNPSRPTPWTVTRPDSGPSIRTPIARNTLRVDRASAPSRKPVTRVVPSAIAPSMIARCEMDLSPGTRSRPSRRPPGVTWYALTLCM